MTDSLDNVLLQFAACGPEFGGGLSNHGPMAAEALVALGRPDDAEAWAEWYGRRLIEVPSQRDAISSDTWREALGDIGRAGDWSNFFDRQLAEQPWPSVLSEWVPRLLPGVMAGATHGVIRTAHAVRSLQRESTEPRIGELALGLAYWAARYQELPAATGISKATTRPAEALANVPLLQGPRFGLIFDVVRRLDAESFAPVINDVDTSIDFDGFVTDITRTFVRQYLLNAQHASIGFVHTVTAPAALRLIAPYMGEAAQQAAMRYIWQACAAIYAAYGRGEGAVEVPNEIELNRDDLIDQAVAARDEHAIKFTEACLREYGVSGDPAFVTAATDAVGRLRAR